MLRHELRQSCLRFYQNPAADYWAVPDAVGNVLWLDNKTIVLSELRGKFTRITWREMLDWLKQQSIQTILCERAEAHLLPCSQPSAIGRGWFWIDVQELLQYFRHHSN